MYPAGGGAEDASALVRVATRHQLDHSVEAAVYGGNSKSYSVACFDLMGHVGLTEETNVFGRKNGEHKVSFGSAQESWWRDPQSACSAIIHCLRSYNGSNPVHRRLRRDLGEDNYDFLSSAPRWAAGDKGDRMVALNAVVAAAIIVVRGAMNTLNCLHKTIKERTCAHVTASILVNRASKADLVISLGRGTVFGDSCMWQGFGVDAREYSGKMVAVAGEHRLMLRYSGTDSFTPVHVRDKVQASAPPPHREVAQSKNTKGPDDAQRAKDQKLIEERYQKDQRNQEREQQEREGKVSPRKESNVSPRGVGRRSEARERAEQDAIAQRQRELEIQEERDQKRREEERKQEQERRDRERQQMELQRQTELKERQRAAEEQRRLDEEQEQRDRERLAELRARQQARLQEQRLQDQLQDQQAQSRAAEDARLREPEQHDALHQPKILLGGIVGGRGDGLIGVGGKHGDIPLGYGFANNDSRERKASLQVRGARGDGFIGVGGNQGEVLIGQSVAQPVYYPQHVADSAAVYAAAVASPLRNQESPPRGAPLSQVLGQQPAPSDIPRQEVRRRREAADKEEIKRRQQSQVMPQRNHRDVGGVAAALSHPDSWESSPQQAAWRQPQQQEELMRLQYQQQQLQLQQQVQQQQQRLQQQQQQQQQHWSSPPGHQQTSPQQQQQPYYERGLELVGAGVGGGGVQSEMNGNYNSQRRASKQVAASHIATSLSGPEPADHRGGIKTHSPRNRDPPSPPERGPATNPHNNHPNPHNNHPYDADSLYPSPPPQQQRRGRRERESYDQGRKKNLLAPETLPPSPPHGRRVGRPAPEEDHLTKLIQQKKSGTPPDNHPGKKMLPPPVPDGKGVQALIGPAVPHVWDESNGKRGKGKWEPWEGDGDSSRGPLWAIGDVAVMDLSRWPVM
eukprot:CAMPEP_0114551504 /NCGR_PEP_ID=MMETSP0114-20121206/6640_1 /TAXON_ID=31324 /ORGANISM="Goniomonas sp, Strain m" /LENGTH=910 /DNA_ID=CAMNT_0001736345 /DNA_START=301 /DNA_END=3034 /DNA_ORIENTATION=+